MTGDQHDIVAILVKYALHEPLGEEEERVLQEWRQRSSTHASLPDQFRDWRWLGEQQQQLHTPPTEAMWEDIRSYIDEEGVPAQVMVLPTKRRIGLAWYPVAAILFAGMIWAGMRWQQGRQQKEQVSRMTVPAGYKALLALDDGTLIVLDTLKKGAIIAEGPIRIRKADSNSYIYTAGVLPQEAILHRMTLAPGAEVCRIQWPNGSSVWLKGGTSMEYAVDLRSSLVELAGEAWFRMTHDPDHPMTVALADGTLTRVLGTSFEARSTAGGTDSRVALFSGRVRVVKGADSAVLGPGAQARMDGQGIQTVAADSAAILAWMRPAVPYPYFDFKDADLLTMLPQIAAWYRVQVSNPHLLRGVRITGEFARNMSLAGLITSLKQVEGMQVQITLREDTIIIAPRGE